MPCTAMHRNAPDRTSPTLTHCRPEYELQCMPLTLGCRRAPPLVPGLPEESQAMQAPAAHELPLVVPR